MALKVTTPSANTGFDPVGADDYRSGMIAARDGSGNIVVCGSSNDPDTGDKPLGLLGEDRLTSALQTTTQVEEQITVTNTVGIALAHDAVVPDSQRVVRVSDSALLVEGPAAGGDYDFNDTTGVITTHTGGPNTVADGDVVKVSYSFKLNDEDEKNFRGVNFKGATDDTEGSKKATVWKGYGEFETDQFVTSRAYAIGDLLKSTKSGHSMGAGLLTNEAPGANVGTTVCARVTKVATASDPFLGLEFNANLV